MMNHKVIAKAYNIPINYRRSPAKYFGWDGTQLNVKGIPEYNVLHEISHYIMAPARYRKYPNFYLGYGPDESPSLYNSMMKSRFPNKPLFRKESQHEEELTCILEFIFAALYQDLDVIQKTMEDRQYMYDTSTGLKWSADSLEFKTGISELQRKKLIDKNWVPIKLKKLVNSKNLSKLDKFKTMVSSINRTI